METLLRRLISEYESHHQMPTWLDPIIEDARQSLRGPAPERPTVVVPEAEDE